MRNALYRSFEEVFPKKRLSKVERRAFIDKRLSRELAETHVMDLAPEKFGVIANLLTSP